MISWSPAPPPLRFPTCHLCADLLWPCQGCQGCEDVSLQPQISPGALLDSDLATPGAPRRRPLPLAGFGPEQCTEKYQCCTKQHGLGAERTMASSSQQAAPSFPRTTEHPHYPSSSCPSSSLQQHYCRSCTSSAPNYPPTTRLLCISLQLQSSGNFRHLRQSVLST